MSGIDFYYHFASPPCRAVLLLARAIGLTMNLNHTDHLDGKTMTPEYLNMNPQHVVPTINDSGFILWESRAIMRYLVNQYDKDGSLVPKNIKEAAIMDQRLYFDALILYPSVLNYFFPVFLHGTPPDVNNFNKVDAAFIMLNTLLQNNAWIAGDKMTIADFTYIATVSTAQAVLIDITIYPNVILWYENTKKALKNYGYSEINEKGNTFITDVFKAKLK